MEVKFKVQSKKKRGGKNGHYVFDQEREDFKSACF